MTTEMVMGNGQWAMAIVAIATRDFLPLESAVGA